MNTAKLFSLSGFLLMLSGSVLAQTTTGETTSTAKKQVHHPTHRREILEQLQLTDDQRKQIEDCRATYRKKMAEINGQLQVEQVELENELEKAEPDQDKLTDLSRKIGDLLGQRILEKVNAKIAIEKQILTPQQTDQLKMLQLDMSSESDDSL